MDALRQTAPPGASERVALLEQQASPAAAAASAARRAPAESSVAPAGPGVTPASTATTAPRGAAASALPAPAAAGPSGFALLAAFASVGTRSSMVTDLVFGPGNQVAQIRVVDAVTHQVISTSPPDSIAHMQLEVQQYEDAAKNKLGST
jgi:hypothetical protein